jgi:hypothetical protein
MYTIKNVTQGENDWFMSRVGLWTASNFSKLITSTGKESTQAKTHNMKLVAESILNKPMETFKSDAMERGNELESEAFEASKFITDIDFKNVGFLDSGEGYGCSPDGLCEEKKVGLELKCPLAHTHIQYIIKGKVPSAYYAQIQGSLMVSGFDRWVFMSYHPELKPLILNVGRDEKYIEALRAMLIKNTEAVRLGVIAGEKALANI